MAEIWSLAPPPFPCAPRSTQAQRRGESSAESAWRCQARRSKMAYASVVTWLGARDRGFSALRRAGRAAIVMPAMFALGDVVIGNPAVATFAAFGSFAMLLLVDFAGSDARAAAGPGGARGRGRRVRRAWARSPRARRGSPPSRWRSSPSACSSPASSARCWPARRRRCCWPSSCRSRCPAPVSSIPDRLAGWGLASAASLLADRAAVAGAGARSGAHRGDRGAAARWRRGCARGRLRPGRRGRARSAAERDAAIARADDAVEALHAVFFATPYRPTGLSTAARAVVRLVDELQLARTRSSCRRRRSRTRAPADPRRSCAVKAAAAAVLERGADLLDAPERSPDALHAALTELRARLSELERGATSSCGRHRDGRRGAPSGRWATSSPRWTRASARRS